MQMFQGTLFLLEALCRQGARSALEHLGGFSGLSLENHAGFLGEVLCLARADWPLSHGCTGPLLLHAGFALVAVSGATLHRGARSSHASLLLWSTGPRGAGSEFQLPGSRAQAP